MSRIVFRIIGVFLLLALLATAGTFIYRAGVADGISQAPQALENASPMMYAYPYHHFGFGFGLFPIFGIFLFLFFFCGLLRLIFARGWSHHNRHGHWSKHFENGVPPIFDEWHKRAHSEEGKQVDK